MLTLNVCLCVCVRVRMCVCLRVCACACVSLQRVWDELDVWHSCLAALEVELQYLEVPEEAVVLQERLSSVQEVHSQLAKQAEQRTGFLSKVPQNYKTYQKTPFEIGFIFC